MANSKDTSNITPIRRTIADRMLASALETAPVTLTTTADATDLVKLREQFKKLGDMVPSFTEFIIKFAGIALEKHPLLNSRWAKAF